MLSLFYRGKTIVAEDMIGLINAAVRNVVEDAARIADRYPHWEHAGFDEAHACCEEIARRIRALKT